MKELDLHGQPHHGVQDTVENFVLMNDAPFRIITGQSEKMKSLVEEVLRKHKLQFYTPAHNFGEIIIID